MSAHNEANLRNGIMRYGQRQIINKAIEARKDISQNKIAEKLTQ